MPETYCVAEWGDLRFGWTPISHVSFQRLTPRPWSSHRTQEVSNLDLFSVVFPGFSWNTEGQEKKQLIVDPLHTHTRSLSDSMFAFGRVIMLCKKAGGGGAVGRQWDKCF